jgi:hypothetical protein
LVEIAPNALRLRLEPFREFAGSARSIAALKDGSCSSSEMGYTDQSRRATEDAAKLLGIAITPLAVGHPEELHALEPAVLSGSNGLTVVNDAMLAVDVETPSGEAFRIDDPALIGLLKADRR